MVGGGGEKRTLRIAAEHADISHFGVTRIMDLDILERKLTALRRHCEAVGRDYDKVRKGIECWIFIGRNVDEAKAKLERIDATRLSKHFKKVKAIATDPPYRRSSFSSKKDISELYNIFLKEVEKILQGYISLMIPKGIKINIPKSLETVGKADLYVHGSLTRRILILKTKSF